MQKGFDDTSISEVAAAAGVAVGTVYLSFPDKPSLKIGVINARKQKIAALIREHGPGRGRTLEETIAMVLEPILEAMLAAPPLSGSVDRSRLEALGEEAVAAFAAVDNAVNDYLFALKGEGLIGDFNPDTSPLIIAGMITSGVECVRCGQVSQADMVSELCQLLAKWMATTSSAR